MKDSRGNEIGHTRRSATFVVAPDGKIFCDDRGSRRRHNAEQALGVVRNWGKHTQGMIILNAKTVDWLPWVRSLE